MNKLIRTYKDEILMAERDMEKWKDYPLNYNLAEQRKTTYTRVLNDLQEYLKINDSLHSVSDFYYLKDGDKVINGDEYLCEQTNKWTAITDAIEPYEFDSEYMVSTRRRI